MLYSREEFQMPHVLYFYLYMSGDPDILPAHMQPLYVNCIRQLRLVHDHGTRKLLVFSVLENCVQQTLNLKDLDNLDV